MRACLGRRKALRAPGNTFRVDTEFPNHLSNSGLEGFGGEGSGWPYQELPFLKREGLFRHLLIRADTIVDTHPNRPSIIAMILEDMSVSTQAEQRAILPSGASAADKVKALARSRDTVQPPCIADLLHDVLQDEEARYATDTASI